MNIILYYYAQEDYPAQGHAGGPLLDEVQVDINIDEVI